MTHLINSHISGVLLVITSVFLQIIVWIFMFQSINSFMLKILFATMFPVYFTITSFFTFYTVNLIYNIFVPPRWIEQNSKYLSFFPPIQIKQNLINESKSFINTNNEINEDNLIIDITQLDNYSPSSSKSSYSSVLSQLTFSKNNEYSHEIFADHEINGDIEMGKQLMSSQKSKSCDTCETTFSKELHNDFSLKSRSLSPQKIALNFNTKNFAVSTHSPIFEKEINTCTKENCNSNKIDLRPVIITIQIPVYTEDFNETLFHTYENIKKFVEYWNENNNDCKANVLIHEDGLQKVNETERNKRISYYENFNDSFYIARQVAGREGKFKKASNMNFGMRQILKINNKNNKNVTEDWLNSSHKLNFMYNEKTASTFEIGKYILLIDSDSRFNPYAIESLIREMEMSPTIGYLQVRTTSNKVIKNTWENAISHFTNSIYNINFLYSCSNGFPAPLVGHNVVLRTEALMNVEKLINGYSPTRSPDSWTLWDETRVSEDFVMSIYLQYLGYYGKYVFYDCGFKEGVSLNIVDEITKLKKYIFGVNEVMFYPCKEWLTNGITSHLYGNFLMSDKISFSAKYSLLSYMGSYYSLALSPIVTCWYYFVKFFNVKNSNLFVNDSLDTIYACAFIFFGISAMTNILVKVKHKFIKRNIFELVFKEIFYGLYLTLFFSSVSWHLLSMMVSFFLNLPAKWETTKKEAEKLSIFTLIWTYKWMYLFGTGLLVLIFYGLISDGEFQNKDPKSVVPFLIMILAHMLLPIYTTLT